MEHTPEHVADGRTGTPAPPEETSGAERVEVHHKPHPVHSWREFLKEVGIIVLGVMIALAAEQALDAVHWAGRVREAEASMRKELAEDDGPQAYDRLVKSPCIVAQLDRLESAIVADRDRSAPFRPQPVVMPFFYTWDSDAQREAVSTGAMAHMSPERAYAWSSPYALTSAMNEINLKESDDYAELMGLRAAPIHLAEGARERLLAAIARARRDDALLTHLARMMIKYMRDPGVVMTEQEERRNLGNSSFPGCSAPVGAGQQPG